MVEQRPGIRVGIDGSILRQFNTGTEEFLESLVRGLTRIGVELVGLGCLQRLDPDRERLGQPLRDKRSPVEKWRWETSGVVRTAMNEGVRILHIPYMAHPPRALLLPTVVNVHDVIPYRFPAYQRRFRDRQYFRALRDRLQYATRLVAVSAATADDFAVVFPHLTDRLAIIPIGPDEAYHMPPTDEGLRELVSMVPPPERPRILYVGGYQPHKNVETLIRALPSVLVPDDAEVVLVGARGNTEIERLTASLPTGHVTLTGRLSRPALRALYDQSTLLAFPSLYEGFGLPPAQAQAAGLPVVVSRGPALQEVLGDGALWADPPNVDDWVGLLHEGLTNDRTRRELIAAGHRQAARFRWDALVPRYQTLYREVLDA